MLISLILLRRLATAAVLAGAAVAGAEADTTGRDAEIRAAMVANFARYAAWPGADPSDELIVCVDSTAPLASALRRLEGAELDGRRVVVETLDAFESGRCRIAVLAGEAAGRDRAQDVVAAGALTVSDEPGFVAHGVVELVKVGRQTRFKINNSLAQRNGVRLSSRLLRLAAEVR